MAQETAKQAYKRNTTKIKGALVELQARLDTHAEEANENGVHWGYVGDLGYVDEKLVEMLEAFMSKENGQ